jgi:hypothetical protein
LVEGVTGNGWIRSKDGLIAPEMDNALEKRIRRKPITRKMDFLWED